MPRHPPPRLRSLLSGAIRKIMRPVYGSKDIKAGSFDAAFAAIRDEIRWTYREHAYLLDEGTLRPEDAARFQQILSSEGDPEAEVS